MAVVIVDTDGFYRGRGFTSETTHVILREMWEPGSLLEEVMSVSPGVKSIVLEDCGLVSDAVWDLVATPSLTMVAIMGSKVTRRTIEKISRCPLVELDLRDSDVTDEVVYAVARGCPQLTSINLSDNPQVGDAAILALTARCQWLTDIILYGCSALTDGALTHVVSDPLLTRLNIEACPLITTRTIAAITDGCPSLLRCSMSYQLGQTDEGKRLHEILLDRRVG